IFAFEKEINLYGRCLLKSAKIEREHDKHDAEQDRVDTYYKAHRKSSFVRIERRYQPKHDREQPAEYERPFTGDHLSQPNGRCYFKYAGYDRPRRDNEDPREPHSCRLKKSQEADQYPEHALEYQPPPILTLRLR